MVIKTWWGSVPKWQKIVGGLVIVGIILYLIFTATGYLYERRDALIKKAEEAEKRERIYKDSLDILKKEREDTYAYIDGLNLEIDTLKLKLSKINRKGKEYIYVKDLVNEEMQPWYEERAKNRLKQKQ